jgi:hypothetical protein
MNVDLTQATARELMQLESSIISQLLKRGLVRTRNKPIGDLAEAAVSKAFGGELARNSKASFDFSDGDKLVQVKALQVYKGQAKSKFQFSAFREPFGFDTCVFVVFEDNAEIQFAYEVSVETIKQLGRFTEHTNSYTVRYTQILELAASKRTDVTSQVSKSWNTL